MSESNDQTVVQLFTDGACLGNPGPGGWAFLLKYPGTRKFTEDSGGEEATTNNRMELKAAINGLAGLKKPCAVEFCSDSQYVLKGLQEWMPNWKKRGWRKADKKPVLNVDLWKELDELAQKHQIKFVWVRGHTGHRENERCDFLASEEARRIQESE